MSDLISKKQIAEKICDLFLDKYEVKANSDLTAFYKEVLKILINEKGLSNWISVKDKLPPNADHPGAFCPRYLVMTDFGITIGWYNPDKGKWYGCGWWMYDTNRLEDVDFEKGDIPKRVILPVEAWMPLPELPKEGDIK